MSAPGKPGNNDSLEDHLTEQVQRLDFAAALRREEEQMALRRAEIPIPRWLLALIWLGIGAVLFGGGVFVGWLASRH